jgi:hypothetical protein
MPAKVHFLVKTRGDTLQQNHQFPKTFRQQMTSLFLFLFGYIIRDRRTALNPLQQKKPPHNCEAAFFVF